MHAHDFSVPDLPEAVDIFDTILRDGSQQEGLSLTVDDKMRVAEQLDHLGVTFIEGGWPGANPKDIEFFARAKKELKLDTATLVAFGSTRRAGVKPEEDAVLANLIDAGAPVACIVAKSWDRHVEEALRTTLDEAVAMVSDSVRYLARARPEGLPRRRTLLRWLPAQPRIRPVGARRGRRGRRRGPGALRHERRIPPRRRRPGRGGRAGSHERPAGDPLSQRHRVRGGELAGRCPGRGDPGAGVHQRLRRAGGQHRPLGGHPQPLAQVQHPDHPG